MRDNPADHGKIAQLKELIANQVSCYAALPELVKS